MTAIQQTALAPSTDKLKYAECDKLKYAECDKLKYAECEEYIQLPKVEEKKTISYANYSSPSIFDNSLYVAVYSKQSPPSSQYKAQLHLPTSTLPTQASVTQMALVLVQKNNTVHLFEMAQKQLVFFISLRVYNAKKP